MEKKKLNKGFLQVYTGNGKGKTTAAIGQAIRAAGAGLRTFFLQFMKEYPYSEIVALKRYDDLIEVEQCGGDDFVYKGKFPSSEEVARVKAALQKAEEKMTSGEFDLVVLDEALVSIYFRLLNTEDLTEFISEKPENVELILTGRYCPEEIIQLADLVTEMKEVKHYYQKGVQARKGIES